MKFTTKFLALSLFGVLTMFSFVSCGDDDSDNSVDKDRDRFTLTIAELLENNSNYSSLKKALIVTDLLSAVSDKNANLTVFAPNNDAFDRFLTAEGFTNGLDDVDTAEEIALVKNTLLNHVIDEEIKAESITGSAPKYIKNLADGPEDLAGNVTKLSTFYDVVGGKVFVNGTVEVTEPNFLDANNGIVHAVKDVISLPKISTFSEVDDRISILEGLFVYRNLLSTIDDLGTATVFAPVNNAFLLAVPLSGEGDNLSNVIKYQVLANVNIVSTDVSDLVGMQTSETLQGQKLDIVEGPALKGKGNMENNSGGLLTVDIQAVNGVIHIIDRVLLPANNTVVTAP